MKQISIALQKFDSPASPATHFEAESFASIAAAKAGGDKVPRRIKAAESALSREGERARLEMGGVRRALAGAPMGSDRISESPRRHRGELKEGEHPRFRRGSPEGAGVLRTPERPFRRRGSGRLYRFNYCNFVIANCEPVGSMNVGKVVVQTLL